MDSGMETAMISVAAPVAEEEQDQRGGQSRRDQRFVDHAGDGGLDEHRLVEQRPHLDFGGQEFFRARQQALQVVDDAQRRGSCRS